MDQIQEIRYQVGEAWKGTYNAATTYGNAAVVQDPTGLSIYRSLKSGNVRHALTETAWWFCIIDMSSIKAEADHLRELDTQMSNNEAQRIENEQTRESHELARVNAENNRIYNEQQRENAESARVQAEQNRVTAENQRVSNEQARVSKENQRIAAEQTRVNQELSRVAAETQRQLNENNRIAAEQARQVQYAADHQQAEADHTQAVADHNEMAALIQRADNDHTRSDYDHTQAVSDHTRADSDHTTAAADHTQAGNDNTRAEIDHTTAAADHTQAGEDHTASVAATEAANTAAAGANALQTNIENGTVKPLLSKNAMVLGYGLCSTDIYTAAKAVTIPNFLLLENGIINVLFTTPINTEHSTLNVSNSGAKPIHILGGELPAGVIKAETYATLVYDGTNWNIINLFCPDASYDPAELLVDMGLPSGVKWASRDIDLTKPGGFCETPFTYEKSFFSWGNIDGHNPTSNSSFSPWNWGGVNENEPYYEGQVYGSTPGNTLTGNIAVGDDYDCARANLGAPWRMPTNTEYGELFGNIDYLNADGTIKDASETNKLVTVNSVVGIWIQSKINQNRLFFSCSGSGNGTSRYNRGSSGYYWSSTWLSARSARYLYFISGGVNPQNNNRRFNGVAVRAVQ